MYLGKVFLSCIRTTYHDKLQTIYVTRYVLHAIPYTFYDLQLAFTVPPSFYFVALRLGFHTL